ncbi:copper resistance protein NlpE N-terminal domain-containing protein [Kushneria phosphatilytica]|uniref:Uncharacterized protein n=1 Tax=Kushneria phosphatilytica TaxID=657387 RepID=A0A1S1NUY2_9GAMM|nr:copper resistance protein NlpE N-terminal domain-containing protein [Kushneria phosphatilytica]OHV10530.1 hypothetical protein BH688_09000 [Kushneria phosphatilytica]QEL11904.1 hypothetical protein FY550_12670 [Kushneria phosphatilytica]
MKSSRRAIALGGLCIALGLGGCAGTTHSPDQQVKEAPVSLTMSDAWQGVLPCVDCQGLETRLILMRSGVTGLPAGYVIDQQSLNGQQDGPKTSRTGDWTIEKGSLTDPKATIFRLDPDTSGAPCLSFQLLESGALRALDCNGSPLHAPREPILQPVQPQRSDASEAPGTATP